MSDQNADYAPLAAPVACPGVPLTSAGRDENGKFQCSCCGRRIGKKGYGHSLAPHKAPSHVVHAHARRVRQEAAEYYQNRQQQENRVDAALRELNSMGYDTSRSEISLPIDTVERLIAIAQNDSSGADS